MNETVCHSRGTSTFRKSMQNLVIIMDSVKLDNTIEEHLAIVRSFVASMEKITYLVPQGQRYRKCGAAIQRD